MSEQPTPETDAFFFRIDIDWDMEVEFARKLERERDEALSQIAQAEKRAERYCQERDEAREALMKIEDLFIDGTDIYADRENMGTIARKALEEAK